MFSQLLPALTVLLLVVCTHTPHLWQQSAINLKTRLTNLLKLVKEKEQIGSKQGSEPNQSFGSMKGLNSVLAQPSPKSLKQISIHRQKEKTKAQRG